MTTPTCQICGRELKAPESIAKGVGPECEAKQQSFLSACGSSLEEIAELEGLDDAAVIRWVDLFAKAMRAGNKKHGRQFIEAARRAVRPRISEIAA